LDDQGTTEMGSSSKLLGRREDEGDYGFPWRMSGWQRDIVAEEQQCWGWR
jgi:hypothetical protein